MASLMGDAKSVFLLRLLENDSRQRQSGAAELLWNYLRAPTVKNINAPFEDNGIKALLPHFDVFFWGGQFGKTCRQS